MKMRYIGAALVMAALAGGCAAPFTDVTKTDMGFNTPADPNTVEILLLRPTGQYKEVAAVVTEGWLYSDIAKMHNDLRQKAAATGANAVVLLEPHYTIDPYWGTHLIGWVGVAIKK